MAGSSKGFGELERSVTARICRKESLVPPVPPVLELSRVYGEGLGIEAEDESLRVCGEYEPCALEIEEATACRGRSYISGLVNMFGEWDGWTARSLLRLPPDSSL